MLRERGGALVVELVVLEREGQGAVWIFGGLWRHKIRQFLDRWKRAEILCLLLNQLLEECIKLERDYCYGGWRYDVV